MQERLSRDVAYARLREMILGGGFGLNEPLSERRLARSLDLGRTPVREAMHRLIAEGLLHAVPARGTFLRQLSFDEVREMYEVRQALEGTAAYLAAKRGGATFGPLAAKFEQLLTAGEDADTRETQDAGSAFHLQVFRASGNSRLLSLYKNLQAQIALNLALTRSHDSERVRQTLVEHLRVLRAIEARDAEAAQVRMAEHLANGLAARARLLAQVGEIPTTVRVPALQEAGAL